MSRPPANFTPPGTFDPGPMPFMANWAGDKPCIRCGKLIAQHELRPTIDGLFIGLLGVTWWNYCERLPPTDDEGWYTAYTTGQPMNATPGAVDDASRGDGLAPSDKHTPSPDGTHRGQSGSSTHPGPAASGNGAGDPTPGT